MKVSVRFFTSLREIVKKKEETIEFSDGEDVTVDKVLKKLSERYGKHFTDYVYSADSGEIKSFLQFLINGKNTSSLNRLQTKIKDGDVLAILPPVGGG